MLEVYFNIIEWGPNVYGIGETASFYFQKKPADLNLNECLYLASIVPKPSKFMFQFNDQGTLREYPLKYQRFLANIMMKRGLLTIDDTIYKTQPLIISGAAKSFLHIKVKDSTVVDSIETKSIFEF